MDKNYINKKIIYHGKERIEFSNGSKVIFHIKVDSACDGKLIDDSRAWKDPIELILGKKFKLEVWETCVQTMQLGEVSRFTVDKKLLSSYPIVAKTLRDHYIKKGQDTKTNSHSCCGFRMKEGLGYEDLNKLMENPEDLIFTIELLKVENEGTYQKEFWAMKEDEQLSSVKILQEEGNNLYRLGNTEDAAKKYSEGIARLENLMLKEKPGDVEWTELNNMKIPLLLNYSQCQLLKGEFYSVIEHCSDVLKYQPDNIKALFRRSKAYVELFCPDEARNDLKHVEKLDPSMGASCQKLLTRLETMEKDKMKKDKEIYKNLFTK